MALDPEYANAWFNLGMVLRDNKDLPAAIHAFDKAINLKADHAMSHHFRGLALRDQGDFVAAIHALDSGHRLGSLSMGWRYPSAAWVKECRAWLALEKRLPGVLQGEPTNFSEQVVLALMCDRFKKRYRDAAALYAKAFAAEPTAAEDLGQKYRFHAARAAALAAAGKGTDADPLEAKEQARLRQQAFDWLHADLATGTRLLEKNPGAAVQIHDYMQQRQRDADLAGLREEKELAKLPADERAAFSKFWGDVENLAKQARSHYTQTEHKGQLSAKDREQSHPIKMTAGKAYGIDMASPQFDTYLRLQDEKGRVVAENDDISPTNLNSRIVFTPREDGAYLIVATSFQQRGAGAYTITVREFAGKAK